MLKTPQAGALPSLASPSLRTLAATGDLSRVAASSSPDEALRLRAEAFEVTLPLVWERHTRPLEARKGHRRCMSAIPRMAPECMDGFTDDLESVVNALLTYRRPIASLEGWISMRMANAIRDGFRVRRAREMGAPQRVRVPARLAAKLGNNSWLVALADRVLQWAGVRHTAGAGLWPLDSWAEDRAALMGRPGGAVSGEGVAAEIDAVLTAMREWNARWYEKYVEGPLGRKWAPVAFGNRPAKTDADAASADHLHLELVPRHERDDARLREAAAASLTMIRSGLAAGDEPRQVVVKALAANYLSATSAGEELDSVPGSGGVDSGEVVSAVLADPAALDRVVAVALDIIVNEPAEPGGPGGTTHTATSGSSRVM